MQLNQKSWVNSSGRNQLDIDEEKMEYIYKIMEKINSTHDLESIAMDIVQMMIHALDCIGGALLIVDEEEKVLRPLGYSQIGTFVEKVIPLLSKPFEDYVLNLKEAENYAARTVTEKKTFIGDQFEKFMSPTVPKMTAKIIQKVVGMKTIVTSPAIVNKKVVGVLMVGFGEKELSEEKAKLLRLFSSQCAIAINNAQKYKKLQSQYKKMQEILAQQADFIAVTAHEFRTPLSIAMFQMSEILHQLEEGKINKKDLNTVQTSLLNLKDLTKKLFDVQQYDLKKIKIKKTKIDLKAFFHDIYADFLGLMQEKKMHFQLKDKLPQGFVFLIDAPQLRQVLHNLLNNAYKFTPEKGSITLQVEADEKRVLIKVIDNGKGIPKNMRTAIFNKFRTNNKGAGIGLGLYICQKIIELHHGRIWVENAPKKGSMFCVQLENKS